MVAAQRTTAERWTISSFKDYIEALIKANDDRYEQRFLDSQTAVQAALSAAGKAVDAALSAAKEAVDKAEVANEKRFEGVNEFRLSLGDQQRTLMPRSEQESVNQAILEKLASHENRLNVMNGQKTGGANAFAYLVAGVGLLISTIEAFALIFHK